MTKYNNMKLVEHFLIMGHFLFKQTKNACITKSL